MNLEAWLTLLEQRHPQAIDLGLQRCGKVYRQLGSPRPAKKVFTVAGTNGKGSTVAYLAAINGALGHRYGTYTSPHIFSFNERISIMGEPVSDETLIHAFEQVESARDDVSLTYFEFTTLAGLLILQQADLDCAVLEVGLGGRLDTVNLVDADCVLVTPIGLDHQDFLGPDIESIAREKAGVMRAAIPVICTQTDPPPILLEIAKDLASPIYLRGQDFELTDSRDANENRLRFSMAGEVLDVARPSMGGAHQLDNLAAALAALLIMNPGCLLHGEQISDAISHCQVVGRLQRVGSSPEILLDVGHNELAAEAVAAYLSEGEYSKVNCVLAMLADKSAEAVAQALGSVCTRWLCSTSPGDRGQTGEMLAQRIHSSLPAADIHYFDGVGESLQVAMSDAGPDDTILVFGSFATVSAASDWLKQRLKHPRHDAAKLTRYEA
jgi:dihydrofolate synthase/folylpolyglutamate synthase